MSQQSEGRGDILTRIAKATASVGVLGKDKTNKHDGYSYLSEEAVKQVVQRVIAEFDLAPKTIEFVVISDEWRDARKGGQFNVIKLKCVLEWDGGVKRDGMGAGWDYNDKALMKAQTAALREAWKTTLSLATGDDPERDEREERGRERDDTGRRPPREQQQQAKPANGNGAPKAQPSKLEGDLLTSLIAELNKREHPGDLKDWADGLMKLPAKDRAPLWAAFADRCKEMGLDPGKTARTGAAS